MKKYIRVLTVAGSDSSGGAGIQADLKAFSALGCYGMTVITALTAQNTECVQAIHEVPPEFVVQQLDAVLEDVGVDAVKIGMLHSPEIIYRVVKALKSYQVNNIVLDPVMFAKSGDMLLRSDAVDALKNELIPVARVLTPNLPEAEVLTGEAVASLPAMKNAARRLLSLGPEAVVVKAGRFKAGPCVDVVGLRMKDGVVDTLELRQDRIETPNNHGAGCTFSSAVAAGLARGLTPLQAIQEAKEYITAALRSGAEYRLGRGKGPVAHFYQFWNL